MPKQPAGTPDPHSDWTQGDFELISSDNVVFKVSSRTLSAVSDVLGDVIETGSGDKDFQLSDVDIEKASILDRFLQLAIHDQLAPPESLEDHDQFAVEMGRLIKFLDKYGCKRLMPQLQLCLLEHLDYSRLSPLQTFAIASAAGAMYVCIKALEKAASSSTTRIAAPSEYPLSPLGCLENHCPLDPGAIAYSYAQLIRPDHAWALSRAWALSIKFIPGAALGVYERDMPSVVTTFKSILSAIDQDQGLRWAHS